MMKTAKPLVAVLCAAAGLWGCSTRETEPDLSRLPDNLPVVSAPVLTVREGNTTEYGVALDVCNKSPHPLQVRVLIEGGMSELPYVPADGTFRAEPGVYYQAGIGSVRRQRKEAIQLKVQWQRGAERGENRWVIHPDDSPTITLLPKKKA